MTCTVLPWLRSSSRIFISFATSSNNKLKTTTVNVSGIVINGVGYGTATVKKIAGVSFDRKRGGLVQFAAFAGMVGEIRRLP